MPHPLGLEFPTVLGLDPAAHVALAARLGYRTVSIGLERGDNALNPHDYRGWSLRDDPQLRRDLAAALADTGIAIAAAEGLDLASGLEVEERAADIDLLAALGVRRVIVRDGGVERARAFDAFAQLAQMAEARGMELAIGFSPVLTIRTLDEALEAAGHSHAAVLIDAMHFFRSGGKVRQIAELDPALIGHVRICDAARKAEGDYHAEQVDGRMIPGQGELPLREFVDALPRGQVLGLDVPLASAARSGRVADDYVGEIARRTREFLA